MKTLPTLAVVALALGLIAAAKAPAHAPQGVSNASALHIRGVIGGSMPMPDFFGSMLTTR